MGESSSYARRVMAGVTLVDIEDKFSSLGYFRSQYRNASNQMIPLGLLLVAFCDLRPFTELWFVLITGP